MKGQTEIISFSLNIFILFLLMVYAYVWGTEIFREHVDKAKLFSAEDFLRDLDSRIQWVAKFGGEDKIYFDVPGTIEIKKNETWFVEVTVNSEQDFPEDWIYLWNTQKGITDFESMIREKKSGTKIILQLIYNLRDGYSIYLVPSTNRIGSRGSEIIIENIGSDYITLGNKQISVEKVKISIR